MEKALTAADDIKAGSFWINDPLTDNEAAPFGGMKMSGGGRELGIEGLDEFREAKLRDGDTNIIQGVNAAALLKIDR